MFEKKQNNEEQNFWVSYADLMAGLLFVFILLVGVIVVKYVYVQSDLKETKTNLQNRDITLQDINKELKNKKNKIKQISSKLKSVQEKKLHLNLELVKLNNIYDNIVKQLKNSNKINTQLNENSKKLNNKIKLLNLLTTKQKILIDKKNIELSYTLDEITKLKDLLLGYELKEKQIINNNEKLQQKLKAKSDIIILKDDELLLLTNKLLTQSKNHQKLVEEFDIAKVRIKSLTGIRLKVVTELKNKLENSINVDSNSGAIRFSSNILFDQGSYKLKEDSKKELSKILKKYINALLLNKNIRKYIDNIIIQGHTNSDGSYMYNLELSQKRALEVMKFLYSLDINNKPLLEQYISASGRSYSDRIKNKRGYEQKNTSRRIEIKFRIKNEEAIRQLSNYLNK